MAEELFIPKLGQTVEEVTLISWLVKDGDKVETGQGILEVETDKAIFTVESTADGIIHMGPFKVGDVIPNLTVVAVIGKKEEKFNSTAGTEKKNDTKEMPAEKTEEKSQPGLFSGKQQDQGRKFISPRARKLTNEKKVDFSNIKPTGGEGIRIVEKDVLDYLGHEIKASPLAKRMAEDAGLDLRALNGTGLQGEITKGDVEKAIAQIKITSVQPQASTPPLAGNEVVQCIPLKGIRALIAERMSASVHTSARFTLFIEADATKLVHFRENLKARAEKEWGFAPSYNDLMAKIAAKALRKFPYVNARLAEDAIEHLGRVHIGMATDTERGLMVPVIRDVDQKNVREFGTQFRLLVEQARSGHIALDNLKGGTFTITNLGNYEILTFVPVINLPEAAILALGKIAPKAVVVGDGIAIRQMWMLALVVDHRIVDGAPAAKFLQFIKDEVENPDEKLFA
jgi:pyruvate dehydrogenase E2 component (dihydrolipoamide acetyltransferase)